MINDDKLCGKVRENHMTMEKLAEILHIDPSTLNRKRSTGNFTRVEMKEVNKALNLSSDEFMAIFYPEGLE